MGPPEREPWCARGRGRTRCGAPLSAAAHRRVCVRVGPVTARRAPSAVSFKSDHTESDETGRIRSEDHSAQIQGCFRGVQENYSSE